MEITEVRVYPVDEDKLKAYVTITFDQCFVVRDLKIIQGTNGLFVAMPSRKRKDGSFKGGKGEAFKNCVRSAAAAGISAARSAAKVPSLEKFHWQVS